MRMLGTEGRPKLEKDTRNVCLVFYVLKTYLQCSENSCIDYRSGKYFRKQDNKIAFPTIGWQKYFVAAFRAEKNLRLTCQEISTFPLTLRIEGDNFVFIAGR